MSLVYITYHNENVLDFDKEDQHILDEHVEYVSKHRSKLNKEKRFMHIIDLGDNKRLVTTSAKCKHRTMGCAETPINPPCNFLRKNQGIKWRRLNDHKCPPKGDRQTIPPPMPLSKVCGRKSDSTDTVCSNIDFVALNIDKIKNAKLKIPPPHYIDTPVGDRHNLLNTGLIPQYTCSKNFGRVPCYLKERKKFLQKLNEQCKEQKILLTEPCKYVMDDMRGLRKMSKEERQEILTGLKKNFAEIFKTYNGLSLYMDTQAKKLRKGKLESQLRQLEQDIFLMESNPDIYVSEF